MADALLPSAHEFRFFFWKVVILWFPIVTGRIEPYAVHRVVTTPAWQEIPRTVPSLILVSQHTRHAYWSSRSRPLGSFPHFGLYMFIALEKKKKPQVFSSQNSFHIKFLLPRESIIMCNYNKWLLCLCCTFLNLIITWQWNLLVPCRVEPANFLVWSQCHRIL